VQTELQCSPSIVAHSLLGCFDIYNFYSVPVPGAVQCSRVEQLNKFAFPKTLLLLHNCQFQNFYYIQIRISIIFTSLLSR
jgi:hypothetical protein